MEQDRIRLRLHWGGAFQYLESGRWGYAGGEVFNEHVDSSCKYADLCCKINDKVGYTTSIKYLCPGEEMSPHELISITGEDDLQELYDEYFQAMQRPGTPVKTFRIKLYLFPALQDEWDADAKPVQQAFDPDEWFDGNAEMDEAADVWLGEQERSSEMMLWERSQQERKDLPSHFVPAFQDHPPKEDTEGLFGVRFDVAVDQQLERYAMGNLMASVSRSRRMGITEEIGLPDPYHESDTSMDSNVQKQRHSCGPDGAPLLQADTARGLGVNGIAGEEATAHVVRLQGMSIDPKTSPGSAHRYSSLAGNFPSHISIFGKDEVVPSGGGGRALSAGADESVGGVEFSPNGGSALNLKPESDVTILDSLGGREMAGVNLPSHISIFGSNSGDDAEDLGEQARLKAMDEAAAVTGFLHTQDFSEVSDAVAQMKLPQPPLPNGIKDAIRVSVHVGVEYEDFPAGGGDQVTPAVPTPKLLEEVVRVPIHEVHKIRKIGEGAFGEVSYANVESHGLVAVKWLKPDRFAKYSESFMREAEVLAKLNHPNIIRMYGVVIEQNGTGGGVGCESGGSRDSAVGRQQATASDQPFIIAGIMTDFVRGGSLSGQLRAAKRRPTLKERCQVAVQACRGMAFLHAQNPAIIHFDLKPDNLLVDGDGENLHVKVADFGLSKHKFQTFVSCRDLRGTLPYMAPELVSNPDQVSERCDVWSMGVVMWEMYTLEVPYNEQSAQQILAALMDGSIHLHIPSACEPEWRSLIEMCMDTNPDARPSFRLLVSHLDAMLRQMGC